MALIKNVTQPTGITVGYWVITGAQFYYQEMLNDVTLAGYISAEAREASAALAPITHYQVRIPFNPTMDPPQEITDMRTVIYEQLVVALAMMPTDPLFGATYDGQLP